MLIRYLDHSMADDLFLQHIALLEHLHNGVFRDGFVLYVGYRVVKLRVELLAGLAYRGNPQLFLLGPDQLRQLAALSSAFTAYSRLSAMGRIAFTASAVASA